MKRFVPWLIAIVGVAGICWRFPLFHVVSLEQAQESEKAAVFAPTKFAESFWQGLLLKSLDQAVPLDQLLPAIAADSAAARRKFGRSLGVSESYTYFIRGTGRVVSTTEDEIELAVDANGDQVAIALQVGLIFNTAVRDGTGLLNVSDYPDSQDFNAIAEALNRIIEEQVQPKLREQAKAGARIEFVGCAEVNDEGTDLKPLKIVPIKAEMQ